MPSIRLQAEEKRGNTEGIPIGPIWCRADFRKVPSRMTRRMRSDSSLARRRPSVKPRECVLIVCEGAKTEPQYFEAMRRELRLHIVEVAVVGEKCGSSPISVVDCAISLRKERTRVAARSPTVVKYDVVWCVMDVEAPCQHDSLPSAIDKAKAHKLRVVLSNPMFEYWYLLHFERTSALMQHNKDVIKRLKKHYPRYQKNDEAFFQVVYPLTSQAIRNSKQVLCEKHYDSDLRKCNPSTHVHLIVEHLHEISRKPRP